ncbi:CHAT domain protein [Tautonia plasticadhaerens]|uniref:CHAT domain protein n=1 Tax=Tautonia plasticadhaerens TaxID=2527974 RepID=A0A518GXY9_9BACT|nr:CHAT domain protein [Tautonia plasticadhaerens]
MSRFYTNLLGRRDGLPGPMAKAEALHEAKQWLRGLDVERAEAELKRLKLDESDASRGERPVAGVAGSAHPFEHPHDWAGFILIGDPN